MSSSTARRIRRLPAPCSMAIGPVARRISPWPSAAFALAEQDGALQHIGAGLRARACRNCVDPVRLAAIHHRRSWRRTARRSSALPRSGCCAPGRCRAFRRSPPSAASDSRRMLVAQIQAGMAFGIIVGHQHAKHRRSVSSCAMASSSRSSILGRLKVGMQMMTRSAMGAPSSRAPCWRTRTRITSSPSRMPPSEAIGPKASSSARVAATEIAPEMVPMLASSLNCAGRLQQHRRRRAPGADRHDQRPTAPPPRSRRAGHSLSSAAAAGRKPAAPRTAACCRPRRPAGPGEVALDARQRAPCRCAAMARAMAGRSRSGRARLHQRGGPHQQHAQRQQREGAGAGNEGDQIGMGVDRHFGQHHAHQRPARQVAEDRPVARGIAVAAPRTGCAKKAGAEAAPAPASAASSSISLPAVKLTRWRQRQQRPSAAISDTL